MSYILDALKKSEQQRRSRLSGSDPGRPPDHKKKTPTERRKRLWPFLTGVALIVNAAILLILFGFWGKREPEVTTVKPVSAPAPPATTAPRGDTSITPPALVKEHPEPPPRSSAAQAPPAAPLPVTAHTGSDLPGMHKKQDISPPQAGEAPRKTAPSKRERGIAPSATSPNQGAIVETPAPTARIAPEPPPPPVKADEKTIPVPPPGNTVYRIGDLPTSVRSGLPSFVVTALLFTNDPRSRMVRINDQMLREGDEAAEGVILEEIGQESAVLRYQGYRFRIPLK